ncbi:Protein transport protein Sec61 subunit gamma [Camellia lanceoleosa]|uniref:Protein transport protein Sec61 subunit gamma n=2 Tax=Camellia lanceoleosa TaxID=1840588 RepID=A0ACC0ISW7_9ERIC|nr:Protein transport protein Sec61 subunit gamma [Camellia lanceoleosa]
MDALDSVFDPLREFAKDSVRLVKRCHKPDRKEFTKVAVRTAIGFVVMGFVGFFVKLIFIPINNIIVGSGFDYLGFTDFFLNICRSGANVSLHESGSCQ